MAEDNIQRSSSAAKLLAFITIAVGVVVIFGWWCDIPENGK